MHLRPAAFAVAGCLAGFGVVPAEAHPHVWVEARASVVYDEAGRISAVTHVWRFDEGYSSYLVQGLDENGDGVYSREELAELAELNATSLVDFDYFTFVTIDGRDQGFADPTGYALDHDGAAATLTFTLPLAEPTASRTALVLEVYDPAFFVAFRIADGEDAVALNGGPTGCAIDVARATEVKLDQFQNLSEAFFEALTAPEQLGVDVVNRALVACP